MTTYYLTTTISDRRYRLPFPFATREAAERHRNHICSQGEIIEVCEPVICYRTVEDDGGRDDEDSGYREWVQQQADYQDMLRS